MSPHLRLWHSAIFLITSKQYTILPLSSLANILVALMSVCYAGLNTLCGVFVYIHLSFTLAMMWLLDLFQNLVSFLQCLLHIGSSLLRQLSLNFLSDWHKTIYYMCSNSRHLTFNCLIKKKKKKNQSINIIQYYKINYTKKCLMLFSTEWNISVYMSVYTDVLHLLSVALMMSQKKKMKAGRKFRATAMETGPWTARLFVIITTTCFKILHKITDISGNRLCFEGTKDTACSQYNEKETFPETQRRAQWEYSISCAHLIGWIRLDLSFTLLV